MFLTKKIFCICYILIKCEVFIKFILYLEKNPILNLEKIEHDAVFCIG